LSGKTGIFGKKVVEFRARAYPCFRQFGSFMKILKWVSCLSYSVAMVHGWSRLWYLNENFWFLVFPTVAIPYFQKVMLRKD